MLTKKEENEFKLGKGRLGSRLSDNIFSIFLRIQVKQQLALKANSVDSTVFDERF